MLFNSFEFILCFLPIVIGLFYLNLSMFPNISPMYIIGLSSCVFYYIGARDFIFILLISITLNYLIGLLLIKRPSKFVLGLGIAANLLLLMYFKYAVFLLNALGLAQFKSLTSSYVQPPLAISFFTFQKIAFLTDIYARKVKKIDFKNFLSFVFFFPQLLAGPIVHYSSIAPQFEQMSWRRLVDRRRLFISSGVIFFVLGLSKKLFLADTLKPYIDTVFDLAMKRELGTVDAWLGSITFSLQLYFDFSGYSDMAIGLSLLFGIKLPLNFNSPYKAVNIQDFWQRWHISLSDFLKRYLYVPLGGNRRGSLRTKLNLLTTMVLGGIWHGAGFNFLYWGAFHGLLLVSHRFLGRLFPASKSSRVLKPLKISATFFLVTIGWVLFRSEKVGQALVVYKSMVGLSTQVGTSALAKYSPVQFWNFTGVFALGLFAVFFAPNSQAIVRRFRLLQVRRHDVVIDLVPAVMGLGLVLCLALISQTQEFIYFRF